MEPTEGNGARHEGRGLGRADQQSPVGRANSLDRVMNVAGGSRWTSWGPLQQRNEVFDSQAVAGAGPAIHIRWKCFENGHQGCGPDSAVLEGRKKSGLFGGAAGVGKTVLIQEFDSQRRDAARAACLCSPGVGERTARRERPCGWNSRSPASWVSGQFRKVACGF